jgi:precorrin-6B C5,15-methyltransferase / cobalt-precorrin-6B C5,C15-methyltransferase
MPENKVYIVGISADGAAGLSSIARQRIRRADVLYGGKRLLAMFPSSKARRTAITANLEEILQSIQSEMVREKIVVLASGDPDFYGIAAHLIRVLGKEAVEIIPSISSMQLAFARIKESWEDAVFVSVHSRSLEGLANTVSCHHKVCILTDEKNNPAAIARNLIISGIENCRAYVCQDLGSQKESIIVTDLINLEGKNYSPLNILILIRDQSVSKKNSDQLFGFPETCFKLRSADKSLITKMEIRAVSLAKMDLKEDSLVWDIGAGSGAISIEASRLACRGQVFAIEKNAGDAAIIRKNAIRFQSPNLRVVHCEAPEGLAELPAPSSVFIGGSGGRMAAILKHVCKRILNGGRIVINAATLENLQTAAAELGRNGFACETVLINVARSRKILDLTRLEALNPVFVLTGWRQEEKDIKDVKDR